MTLKVGRTVILPLALNGCATWSFTLSEEHRLGVFENKLLRKIFGPKKEKVTQGWGRFHDEEFCDSNSLLHNIWVMKLRKRYAGHCCGAILGPWACWSERE